MNFAYLNSDGAVLGLSTVNPLTVEEYNSLIGIRPSGHENAVCIERIEGAPDGLKPYLGTDAALVEYSRKTGGTGTDPGDYETLEWLDACRVWANGIVDETAVANRMASGYLHEGPSETRLLAIGEEATNRYDQLLSMNTAGMLPLPMTIPAKNQGETYTIIDASDLGAICAGVLTAAFPFIQWQAAKQAEIEAATSKEAIDAILNNL